MHADVWEGKEIIVMVNESDFLIDLLYQFHIPLCVLIILDPG